MVDKSKVKIPVFYPVDLNSLPMKLAKIEIDGGRCTVPYWCKKCLENCPHLVFWVESVRDERLKESDPREPGLYRLLAVRRDKCTLCNRCVELCPEGAITITYGDKVFKGKKTEDTAKKAKESTYPRFVAPEPYSFDLNEDMVNLIQRECDPQKAVEDFARAVSGKTGKEMDRFAEDVFGEYGKAWMKRVIQLGDEYSDRTREVMEDVIAETGEYRFPHVPQRYLEIAYLSTQKFLQLPVLENYRKRLLYQVPDCYMYGLIKEKAGAHVAKSMPCRHACLVALEVLDKDLGLETVNEMTASTAGDGYCEFSMKKMWA